MDAEYLLVTDYGSVPYPEDMRALCPLRKDGWPDQRYKAAALWHDRYEAETKHLLAAYVDDIIFYKRIGAELSAARAARG